MRAFNAIELAGKVEWPVVRPGEFHQSQIFRRTPVALVLRAEVSVSVLLIIRFARDDVDGKPAAGQMVERGYFAREQRRSNKAGPVRNEIAEPFSLHRRIKGNQEPLG